MTELKTPALTVAIDDEHEQIKKQLGSYILYLNCTYIATIGVSGLILCALGSNLHDLTNSVHEESTLLLGGRIFVFRGYEY